MMEYNTIAAQRNDVVETGVMYITRHKSAIETPNGMDEVHGGMRR
jgi:hypothetical protein